jgi:hypothetical protein
MEELLLTQTAREAQAFNLGVQQPIMKFHG